MYPLTNGKHKPLTSRSSSCLITIVILVAIASSSAHHQHQHQPNAKCHRRAPDRRLFGRSLELEPPATSSTPTSATINHQQQQQPDFEAPIGNQTVAVGRDAQLSCKIKDLGNFRTAWLRVEDKGILTIHNNVITRNYRFGLINSDDGKEFVLTIKNVQPSDRGGYLCQINSVPMKYAIGYLDVLTPPAFDEEPKTDDTSNASQQAAALTTVSEGTNTTLACKASGHPTPEIAWRREDGKAILLAGGAESLAKVEGAPTLALGPVSRLNAGAYLCIASNGVQPSASKRQVLDVQFGPVIRLPETEVGAPLNEPELTLNCYIELNPPGDYHWARMPSTRAGLTLAGSRQEGVAADQLAALADDAALIEHDQLTNSDKFEIVMRQMTNEQLHMSLTIRKLDKSDFGWYKCIARNSLGIQSSAIRLYETSGSGASNRQSEQQATAGSGEQSDQAARANGRQHGPVLSSRAHTRSSWIQRSTSGGSGRQLGEGQAFDSGASATSGWHERMLLVSVLLPMLLLVASRPVEWAAPGAAGRARGSRRNLLSGRRRHNSSIEANPNSSHGTLAIVAARVSRRKSNANSCNSSSSSTTT